MSISLESFIAWRYTKATRRTQLVSLISAISISGVALGVMALITILAIMNGFEREMRERLLGMTAHFEAVARHGRVADWRALGAALDQHPAVAAWAPFVDGQALLAHGAAVQGVRVRGLDPVREGRVTVLGQRIQEGALESLAPSGFNVLIGRGLADVFGLNVGDQIMLVLAEPLRTATGMLPRMKRFTVAGIFDVGVQEFDTTTVFMHIDDAARVFRRAAGLSGVHGVLADPFAADAFVAGEHVDAAKFSVKFTSWTVQHADLFHALRTEKIVMFAILLLSVGVAAFNLVSTLVMMVAEKTAEIAILLTLGLTPARVLRVFFTQGAVIGIAGVIVGGIAGVLLASYIDVLVAGLEHVFGFKILAPEVYYISEIPADLRRGDVYITLFSSALLCLVAPLYPAWLASRTRPATVLRYE